MSEPLKQPGFGHWLCNARIQHGLTQTALAKQLDIDPKTVQRWERGGPLPRPYLLPKLTAALGPLPEKSALELHAQAPAQVTNAPPLRYDAHTSWVVALDWEPHGTRIASAAGDGTVRVWEAETGESHLIYQGHTHPLKNMNIQATIHAVAWAPEGKRIVSAGDGTAVHVWDATTGQRLTLYQGHSGQLPMVSAVAWSPDGTSIASACCSIGMDKTIHIWDSASGQTLTRYDAQYGWTPHFGVSSVAWSPDGTHIAAICHDKTLRIWSTATGRLCSTYHFRSKLAGHIVWSPDSRYLASAHSDHTARIWDTSTGANLVYYGHDDNVRAVAWSPDGTEIATASNDTTIQIWEPFTCKRLSTYRGHSDWTTAVVWSPDGTRLASASNDKTVHIWKKETRSELAREGIRSPNHSLDML